MSPSHAIWKHFMSNPTSNVLSGRTDNHNSQERSTLIIIMYCQRLYNADVGCAKEIGHVLLADPVVFIAPVVDAGI